MGAALGACGVATDDAPHAIARSEVPFHLLAPASPVTQTTTPVGDQVVVYFIDPTQRVAPVYRFVTAPARLLSVMQALVQGPTSAQLEGGLLTDISTPQVQVLSASVGAGGVATIDFNGPPAGGSQLVPALAQVVYTATRQPGVQKVRFEIGGKPTDVPTASNSEVSVPVGRADYALPYAPASDVPAA